MFPHLGPRERYGWLGIGAVGLIAAAYIGAGKLRPPAPISIQGVQPTATQKPEKTTPPTPAEVVVHVAGAVKNAGLFHLPASARVDDAIMAAGGATNDADFGRINLAAKLVDGDKIFVPSKTVAMGEATSSGWPPSSQSTPYDGASLEPSRTESTQRGRAGSLPEDADTPTVVSLNTSTKEELESLPGVGPVTAQKILDYRMEHGGFSSIEELRAVKGIGEKKLEQMRPYLRL